MNDTSPNTGPAIPETRAVVVFGRDGSGKPHASRFDEADAELATKAAGRMSMHFLRLETPDHRGLAAKLPQGRLFASGRAFVPFVKAALYGSLAAMAGVDPKMVPRDPKPAPMASAAPHGAERNDAGEPTEGAPDSDPDTLAVGSVVLAFEGPGMGWWEAVVTRIRGDFITLRWRDFPDLAQFARRRDHLAHLPPGAEVG